MKRNISEGYGVKIPVILIGAIFLDFLIIGLSWAQNPAISVDVGIQYPTVELFAGEPPVAGTITVTGKVKNITKEELSLSEFTCSYLADWKTDNKSIVPVAQACMKNYPRSFTLKPGEVWKVMIPLNIFSGIPAGDIHFKLGYNAYRAVPWAASHELGRIPLGGGPFWSKEIVLHVKSASAKKQKYWQAKEKWLEDFRKKEPIIPMEDGIHKRYYFTGELFDESVFKRWMLNGVYKRYHQNGRVEMEINYKNGKKDGEDKSYDEEGRLTVDELYSDGERVSYIDHDQNGSVRGDVKFMKKGNGKYIKLKEPCAEKDSDKSVLSFFPMCS